MIYRYVPPEPKEWVSLGSEVEIEEEAIVESREKVRDYRMYKTIIVLLPSTKE